MQQQQPQPQSQNNMITPIDKIPLKTAGILSTDDMSDDPIVKDVLTEFEQELSLNNQQQMSKNNYQINNNQQQQYQQQQYQQQQQQQQQQYQQQPIPQIPYQSSPVKQINYIDNILITKTFIICIIIAIVTNPYIYSTIISNIPDNFSAIIEPYNYFIKIIVIFIAIYAMMFYKLL
jgi:hypothetical protein